MVAQDRARAERTRTEFHAALKPADRELAGQRLRGRSDHFRLVENREARTGRR
jgi:hypothetical protein